MFPSQSERSQLRFQAADRSGVTINQRNIVKTVFLALLLSPLIAFANDPSPGVPAEQSLTWLKNGNSRYLHSKLRSDGQSKKDVERLSHGQKPHAIILSCSDSRVPPELLFDQKLGELFVIRTAGQALADNAIGSIEYAVEHLGSKLIVVMGHTACGAVKAAHGSLDGSSVGTPALDGLVKDIHPRISSFKGKTPSSHFEQESWANAEGVAQDLAKRSKLLADKVKKGDLKIVPSLYNLQTGVVTFHDQVMPVREVASQKPAPKKSGHGHHDHGHSHDHH